MSCIRFARLRNRARSALESPEVNKPLDKAEQSHLDSLIDVKATADVTHDIDDKETKIDLEAAIRAVNVALNGLEIGGKRQSPTPPRPETAPVPQTQVRTRPGLPRAIRRFAKFVTPQQRQLQDAFNMQQPMPMPYQQQRPSSTDFLMNSGDLLSAQLNGGYFPNGMEMRSNYSESDLNTFWGSGDGWNVQQLQSLLNAQQGLAANGVSRHMSADFAGNPQLHKYAMDNAITEFLMNSNDSFSSKIEVPKGSGRGDSFSSKIEFPVNCDSFTSKMSAASHREDSFTSQPLWNRGVEPPMSDALMDTAYSIPESIVQELECLAEGDATKESQDISLDIQVDPHTQSEQAILFNITRTLKRALEGTLCQEDLASDLNYLTITVRRHLMDFQTFSSAAAEKFLLVGSTLPVVCRAAMFNDDVVSLLKRFMDIIASGHRMLTNASVCVAPAEHVDHHKQREAIHMLTNIHRTLTGEHRTDNVQPYAAFDTSGSDRQKSSPTESALRTASRPSSDTSDSFTQLDTVCPIIVEWRDDACV